MLLLGLGYRARSGKDTAGEAIMSYYNSERDKQRRCGLAVVAPEVRIFKFADALYKVCREEYGMVGKDAPLLQKVGEGRRFEFGLNYWINQLEAAVVTFSLTNRNGIAIITDVRYQNEGDWVKSKGGYLIETTRLNQDGSVYISPDRDPNFVSETQLHNYNFDAHIVSKSAALTAELAITHAEYFRSLSAR